MKTYWKAQALRNGNPRYYLFNEKGLLLGRVEKTSTGFWQAYVGRPGILLRFFGDLSTAKRAVERTLSKD